MTESERDESERESFLGVEEPKEAANPYRLVVCSTFLGLFMASSDDTIITAAYGSISSEFHALEMGSWLLTGYNFGYCVTLPMYGMLCDIYYRKALLLASYGIFGLGCLVCGWSVSMSQLIVGRAVVGAGSSGMISLSSVAVTDMVPSSERSIWQGWIMAVSITGRSLGAPLGVFLMKGIGWRWLFLGQVPLLMPCVFAVIWKLPMNMGKPHDIEGDGRVRKQLDWLGMLLFTMFVFGFMWSMGIVGTAKGASMFLLPVGLMAVSGGIFWLVESRWATTPMIPLEILTKYSLGCQCVVQFLVYTARSALLANIVPFFMRVRDMADTQASMFLVATSVGLATGSMGAGYIIRRLKCCKPIAIVGLTASVAIHLMIFLRWRHVVNFLEGLYAFPAGVATGLVYTCQFFTISNAASGDRIATCVTVFLFSCQMGIISGSSLPSALLQRTFSNDLVARLGDGAWPDIDIHRILNEILYSRSLRSEIQTVICASYLYSFQSVSLYLVVCTVLALSIFLLAAYKSII